eukprot:TRINITY_DN1568_c0_g1_i3.p3 TRINITY_DN1568_c0_g1~~TRINITY_DN1568_c0_g1_i3.p3  ORF type:complete len:116 (-),score=0.28 TRINITY_DN1568_c0_g1_i3:1014-1361(-)
MLPCLTRCRCESNASRGAIVPVFKSTEVTGIGWCVPSKAPYCTPASFVNTHVWHRCGCDFALPQHTDSTAGIYPCCNAVYLAVCSAVFQPVVVVCAAVATGTACWTSATSCGIGS